jgi:hypothetical protein
MGCGPRLIHTITYVQTPPQSKVTPCCFSHIPHGTQIDVTHGIASLEITYGS